MRPAPGGRAEGTRNYRVTKCYTRLRWALQAFLHIFLSRLRQVVAYGGCDPGITRLTCGVHRRRIRIGPGHYAVGVSAHQTSTPPPKIAAFFDLDKTLIAKSSTLAFSRPFFDEGLLNRRAVLKSSYAQFLFLLSGADSDQMDRMRRHITEMCKGWDVEQIRAIVRETLHDIVTPLVFAEAAELIADHTALGHDIVVVSASGEEVVAPISEALGADHSCATRMEVRDGKYTGEVSFYCFGDGKVQAMNALAQTQGYDLSVCHAYSDSSTDLPMLEAVGKPTAVNPDRQLRRMAAERGWPVLTFADAVSLQGRRQRPSTSSVLAGTAAGVGAVAAGTMAFRLLRRGH